MATREEFDEYFSRAGKYYGEPSDGLIAVLSKYAIPSGRVLDVGAGEGRNTIFLAENGFTVLAVEPSRAGAKKIIESVTYGSDRIRVLEDDIQSVDLPSDVGIRPAGSSCFRARRPPVRGSCLVRAQRI